ncbi:hypothetical protein [Clostridium pasteurianum]|uniref:Phage minor structural protein n=1 Tax=Clostridium pasteurianum BC1 TaxID=86416 RepID=R4K7D9_CLOPA|nr:hypothetical protein [Clostridium pasteurianum]AGK97621.1 hypothetical protein Clopa_2783 [Clostridium pasteurianum BC1]
MKIIRIFNKDHVILDELSEYSNLTYTWTLNGLGSSEFDIPLSSSKSNEVNLRFKNHIEIIDENNSITWGGIITDREFQDNKIHVSCYGYLGLLWKHRMRATTYPNMSYGSLLQQMIIDTNTISLSGVSIGNIENGSLYTQRSFTNNDMLLDKVNEIIGDTNNNIEVDNNRNFNFYLHKGSDKSYYTLQYGTQGADNILVAPTLHTSILNSGNSIYSECTVDSNTLTSTAQDQTSIDTYGLIEDAYSAPNNITDQSTLNNVVNGVLQREAYPINNITLSIKDSALCPYNNVFVGDTVNVYLRPYWEFEQKSRILEIKHNESNGLREITVGGSIFRNAKPQIKLYSK